MKLYSPKTIVEIGEKYKIKPVKSLGQNFLADRNIIEKIIDETGIEKGDLVIEVGPGMGVLTEAAAKRAGKVVAVEIDRNLIPVLQETLQDYDNVEILCADILKTDIGAIVEQNGKMDGQKVRAAKVIGNIPYYITTPIIMRFLEEQAPVCCMTFMMQKEVADRLKAPPGTRAYGAISVAVQYYCTVRHIANVPKEVFVPRPKVDSAIIRLDVRGEPPVALDDESAFFACVKAGFEQRRKTLLNALAGGLVLDKQVVLAALAAAGIDPRRRAETLSLSEFAALSNRIRQGAG